MMFKRGMFRGSPMYAEVLRKSHSKLKRGCSGSERRLDRMARTMTIVGCVHASETHLSLTSAREAVAMTILQTMSA